MKRLRASHHVAPFRPAYIPQIARPDLFIVRGPDGIQEVLDRLSRGILATDTETSGLDWSVHRVGALCFAAGQTSAMFVKDALPIAARWFANQVKRHRPLVFHNGKFDMHHIRETFGIHIAYPVHDTLVMSKILDNRGPPKHTYPFFHYEHGLDVLAEAYVDPLARQPHLDLVQAVRDRIGKRREPVADWLMAPMRTYGVYGGLDPWYTLRLYDQFITRIANWSQPEGYPSLMSLYQNERWLMLALRDMEERGVVLDRDYLYQWVEDAAKKLTKLEKEMHRARCRALRIDREMWDDTDVVNWRSHVQVKNLFWNELELDQIHDDSTNKRSLLRMRHPLAPLLLQHRKMSKMVSSGRTLIRNVKADGALHASYNQNVDTGRMSAKDGVHQFARESGVRKGVIPRKGLVIRSADYSQIEMRFAAHYSGEETLIKGFRRGGTKFDTHAALARRMFGIPKGKDPTPGQRDRGKTMNFAMLYGAGIDAVTEQLIDKISSKEARQSCRELGYTPGLSESPFHSLAELLRDAVRDSYPKIWEFTRNENAIARQQGFVVDAFGYHRYLDDDKSYRAMNSKLQGSAAHQAKVGFVNVYRDIQLATGNLAQTMQVHDDVVYESDGDSRTDKLVLESLEDHHTFKVPIVADLKGSAKNWQDKESIYLTEAA